MTSIDQEAPQLDAAEPAHADARTELRDALVAIAVAIAGVASAVAIVVVPQLLPSPAQTPVVCKATPAQRPAEAMIARHRAT